MKKRRDTQIQQCARAEDVNKTTHDLYFDTVIIYTSTRASDRLYSYYSHDDVET